jgi:hypothetical protein
MAKKINKAPSASKAAKEARKKASPNKKSFENAGALLARKNIKGKLGFFDADFSGKIQDPTKLEKKSGKIIGTRMKNERSRAATRAEGIAAREKAKAKARRAKKALGN